MKIRKGLATLLSIAVICSFSCIGLLNLAFAQSGYKTQEIALGENATQLRTDGTNGELFGYVNKAINWDTTETVEMQFSFNVPKDGDTKLYNDKHYAIVMNDITENGTPNFTNLTFYKGASYYKGIQFDYKSASDWNGCMQMAVYDGTGENHSGAYSDGWGNQFTSKEGASKESGTITGLAHALYYGSNVTVSITRDAEYYNFSFKSENETYPANYTYSVLRTRVNNGTDFVNNPYLGLYCIDQSSTLSADLGFNVNYVKITEKNSIKASSETLKMIVGEKTPFSAKVITPDGKEIAKYSNKR